MYLKKLYQQHKGWCIFIVCFALAQLFINYKRGVVFSPFFHYGMYSAVMQPESIYIIPEIKVNGKLLQSKDFTPQQWDNINQPVVLYEKQQQNNSNMFHSTIQRLLHITDSSVYVNNLSPSAFQLWYMHHLQSILQQKIDSVQINDAIKAYSHQSFNNTQ
jgi:hypothetical protein